MEQLTEILQKIPAVTKNESISPQHNSQKAQPLTNGFDRDAPVAIAAITGETALTESDTDTKRIMLGLLGTAYRLDYFDTNSVHFHAARDLFRRATQKGWTAREFLTRLDEMIEECRFPTWTPADFFAKDRAMLHPYSWVLAERQKDPNAMQRMEAYQVEGQTKPMWRYTDGITHGNTPTSSDKLKLIYRCGTHYKNGVAVCYDANMSKLNGVTKPENEQNYKLAEISAKYFAANETIEALRTEIKNLRRQNQFLSDKINCIFSSLELEQTEKP